MFFSYTVSGSCVSSIYLLNYVQAAYAFAFGAAFGRSLLLFLLVSLLFPVMLPSYVRRGGKRNRWECYRAWGPPPGEDFGGKRERERKRCSAGIALPRSLQSKCVAWVWDMVYSFLRISGSGLFFFFLLLGRKKTSTPCYVCHVMSCCLSQ